MQAELPLLGRLDGPSAVPTGYINQCHTYRDAVRLCWQLRRVKYMTHAQVASEAELCRQHVSDYLNPDNKETRRDLPAQRIAQFEAVVGNTLVSQWVAAQSKLTVLEEMQATRMAA